MIHIASQAPSIVDGKVYFSDLAGECRWWDVAPRGWDMLTEKDQAAQQNILETTLVNARGRRQRSLFWSVLH